MMPRRIESEMKKRNGNKRAFLVSAQNQDPGRPEKGIASVIEVEGAG